ncbi:TM2 domain-containing protein [Leptotrichia sp. oral taxon 879]|uniref:TM2 domain-containing protein n=1 Tax=Leptotrichia mesophila TaxID=3239303 RepID=A0AB39V8Y9_9FUSO|nr:TM2 domain-containing protein [Leptotrichia sp. oral taxon 879]ERK51208.1 TM2 domain protein [Leptotrichia sp. oral taxon 879 str. F0557]
MSETNLPENAANGNPKYNKAIYCLLAWFLGCFGIHAFYAGRKQEGIYFLIAGIIGMLTAFLFIGGIILLVEFVICVIQIVKAIQKPADEFGRISD